MVFESVVAEILNRFLGDYVENLDHSQLKIGIWGGKSNTRAVFFCIDVFKCSVQQSVEKENNNKTLQFVASLADAYVFAIQCFSLAGCSVTIYVCSESCR